MSKSIILKIWHDPVWSKVIAAGITAILTAVVTFVVSMFSEMDFFETLCAILSYGIPLWLVAIVCIVGLIIYGVYRKIRVEKEKADKEIADDVVQYSSPFITFRSQGTGQRYCANCWNKNRTKIQLNADFLDCFECPSCHTKGNFSDLEKKGPQHPFYSIYRF